MTLRILITYLLAAALAFLLLRSKNVALRESILVAQAETLPSGQRQASPKVISKDAPVSHEDEETTPPADITAITEPIVIPASVSEMADMLADYYLTGTQLEKLGETPGLDHPFVRDFMRSLPALIGAFDVHGEALKEPKVFGSFMASFTGQALEMDADKTLTLSYLYEKHRHEAISQGLVNDSPSREAKEDYQAWQQERQAFNKAFRETVKSQTGADLEPFPTSWSVTSQISEMKQSLSF